VLLWILLALLTAAAVMAVLVPLGRKPAGVDAAAHARQVYLDQLKELERERAEGAIGAAEAEAARVEIARRLLASQDGSAGAVGGGNLAARRITAVAALIGIPALSLGLYLGLGSPSVPGQPLAARLAAPPEDDIQTLIARVERHLAENPEDGRGWDVIAPVYTRLGRAQEAVTAYRNAIRILGSTEARQTRLGEAIMATAGGIVTAEAHAAFEAARAANPAAPAARFYLALAKEQEGDRQAAAAGWRAMLAEAPADAPWRGVVQEALARVEERSPASAPAATPAPAPNAEQVAAAAEMAPADQSAMIEGMVSGLAERLRTQPDDVEGWLRLIRSYAVLGRMDAAQEAGEAALKGLPQPGDRERVAALIADLGVAGSGAATQ